MADESDSSVKYERVGDSIRVTTTGASPKVDWEVNEDIPEGWVRGLPKKKKPKSD